MLDVCHTGNNDDCKSITVDVSNSTILGVLFVTELSNLTDKKGFGICDAYRLNFEFCSRSEMFQNSLSIIPYLPIQNYCN